MRMENAAWEFWRHSGSAWIFEDQNANDQKFYGHNGNGWDEGHELYRWVSFNVVTQEHTWQRVLHTDKYAPTLAPQSVTISNVNGGLGTNHVDVGWAEATNHEQYDLLIQYRNNTDPSQDEDILLTYPRNGAVTYRFTDAGADGDIVHAFLRYFETGVNPFGGPTAQTAQHTIT